MVRFSGRVGNRPLIESSGAAAPGLSFYLAFLDVLEKLEELDILDCLEELKVSRIARIASFGVWVGDLVFFYYICYFKCVLNHEENRLYYLVCRIHSIGDALGAMDSCE
jgi:hypothetical protein